MAPIKHEPVEDRMTRYLRKSALAFDRCVVHLTGSWPGRTVLALIVVSFVFSIFPSLDLLVSGMFVSDQGGFPLTQWESLKALRLISSVVTIAIIATAFGAFLLALVVRRPRLLAFSPSGALFIMLSYALGPGLLVNVWFKQMMGRARPRDVEAFGGNLDFTAAWQISDQCARNCSFTSGEAASAVAMVSLLFVIRKSWRWPVGIVLVPLMVAFSVNRIAFGGHFLSDVLLSWLLVMLIMYFLNWLLLRPGPAFQIDEAILGRFAPNSGILAKPLARLGKQNSNSKQGKNASKEKID